MEIDESFDFSRGKRVIVLAALFNTQGAEKLFDYK